jgi:hypothetical protein
VLGAGEIESAAIGADDDITAPSGLLEDEYDEDEDEDLDDLAEEVADDEDDVAADEDVDEIGEEDDDSPVFGRAAGTPWQTPSPTEGGYVDAGDETGAHAG